MKEEERVQTVYLQLNKHPHFANSFYSISTLSVSLMSLATSRCNSAHNANDAFAGSFATEFYNPAFAHIAK